MPSLQTQKDERLGKKIGTEKKMTSLKNGGRLG
jgi:hypothetical protein